ncbi:hypothetical protein GCM10008967_28670 [Bacillus carboniphilus]|uniref:Uncharacterized protein n=1 Tax=Bacillus carboniphilus TaxID=86663 RepID=A0ABP3G6X0_9BACI
MKNKRKNLLLLGLILSIILNLYLFQQLNDSKDKSRIALFEKIKNGVSYSYEFGETLQRKYNDVSEREKAEYLTAMFWSLQLSTHMLEAAEPNDDRYRELAGLFSIYSHIPSSNDLGELINKVDVSDENKLKLLDIWLSDMKYLDKNLHSLQLAEMDYSELRAFWEMLLQNLEYEDEALNRYKQSFLNGI